MCAVGGKCGRCVGRDRHDVCDTGCVYRVGREATTWRLFESAPNMLHPSHVLQACRGMPTHQCRRRRRRRSAGHPKPQALLYILLTEAPVTTVLMNLTRFRLALVKSTRSTTALVMSAPSKLAFTA